MATLIPTTPTGQPGGTTAPIVRRVRSGGLSPRPTEFVCTNSSIPHIELPKHAGSVSASDDSTDDPALGSTAPGGMVSSNSSWDRMHQVNRYNNPGQYLRYVKHTINTCLAYRKSSSTFLNDFSDPDWACIDDRKSKREFAIFYGSNLVSWSVRKQAGVSQSSTKVEYKAFANNTLELIWVQLLLKELGMPT